MDLYSNLPPAMDQISSEAAAGRNPSSNSERKEGFANDAAFKPRATKQSVGFNTGSLVAMAPPRARTGPLNSNSKPGMIKFAKAGTLAPSFDTAAAPPDGPASAPIATVPVKLERNSESRKSTYVMPSVKLEKISEEPPHQLTAVQSSGEMKENMVVDANDFNTTATFDVEESEAYDPSRPNDYIAWCEERLQMRKLAKLEEENKRVMEEQARRRQELEQERAEALRAGDVQKLHALGGSGVTGADVGIGTGMGRGGGRGRGGISNLPAWMTQQQNNSPLSATTVGTTGSALQVEDKFALEFDPPSLSAQQRSSSMAPPGADASAHIKAIADKLGNASGLMAPPSMAPPSMMPQSALSSSSSSLSAGGVKRKQVTIMGLFSKPSRILLLKNMVLPSEVDDMLAEETKMECVKYGPVSLCVVFEVTDEMCPETDRVRTFVQFERQESAVKAYRDMNGRFFGGRQISASFYDEEKFDARDLAPIPGEW